MIMTMKVGKERANRVMAAVLLSLLLLSLFTGCASVEKKEAKQAQVDFNTIVSDIQSLQSSLASKITEAENLEKTIKPEGLLDPVSLETLKERLTAAKKQSINVPLIAEQTDDIHSQIQELSNVKQEVKDAVDGLDSAIIAVNKSKQERLDAAIHANHTISTTFTDGNGYKVRATVKLGDWIKGTETDMLQRAWGKVGGKNDMPLVSGNYGQGSQTTYGLPLKSDTAIYVFGTVSFSNVSAEYPAKNFGNGRMTFNLTPRIRNANKNAYLAYQNPGSGGMGHIFALTQYSAKNETQTDLYGSESINIANPDLVSNHWGPAPFVIAIDNVFNPKNPDGHPKVDEIVFRISCLQVSDAKQISGETELKIGKTW